MLKRCHRLMQRLDINCRLTYAYALSKKHS